MDREAWWAIVHGVTRVRHDLATNTQGHLSYLSANLNKKRNNLLKCHMLSSTSPYFFFAYIKIDL